MFFRSDYAGKELFEKLVIDSNLEINNASCVIECIRQLFVYFLKVAMYVFLRVFCCFVFLVGFFAKRLDPLFLYGKLD